MLVKVADNLSINESFNYKMKKKLFMTVQFGKGKTEYGTGVQINLTGAEVAIAIHAYLVSHGIIIDGARTITVNGQLCKKGEVYVDPSGKINIGCRGKV